jgi:two-component system, LytTR family, response regulator LytT
MNLIIVEKSVREARRLSRMLRLIDPTLKVADIVAEWNCLPDLLQSPAPADIVLVNPEQVPGMGEHVYQVQAKLVLRTRNGHTTYFAFRTHTILQWSHYKTTAPRLQYSDHTGVDQIEEPISLTPSLSNGHLFRNRFFVEQGQKYLSVPVEDIAYFFSDGRFIYFSTYQKNKYLVHYRIEELEAMLDPAKFYRINRSYIISIGCIEQISAYFGGRFKLKLQPAVAEDILVSRKRAQGFKRWLGE